MLRIIAAIPLKRRAVATIMIRIYSVNLGYAIANTGSAIIATPKPIYEVREDFFFANSSENMPVEILSIPAANRAIERSSTTIESSSPG
jgi:hypothetical protein